MKKILVFLFTIFIILFCYMQQNLVFAYASNSANSEVSENDEVKINGFFSKFGDFLKRVVIPDDDFFKNWLKKFKDEFNRIGGNVNNSFDVLKSHIENLKKSSENYEFTWTIKDNSVFYGFKGLTVDLFANVVPILKLIRSAISGFLVIFTSIFVYKSFISLTKGD